MSATGARHDSLIARAISHESARERRFRGEASRFAEYGVGIFYHHRARSLAGRVEETLKSWGFAVGCFDETTNLEAATLKGAYLAYTPVPRERGPEMAHAVLRALEPFGLFRDTILHEGDLEAGPGAGTRFRTAPNYMCLVIGG